MILWASIIFAASGTPPSNDSIYLIGILLTFAGGLAATSAQIWINIRRTEKQKSLETRVDKADVDRANMESELLTKWAETRKDFEDCRTRNIMLNERVEAQKSHIEQSDNAIAWLRDQNDQLRREVEEWKQWVLRTTSPPKLAAESGSSELPPQPSSSHWPESDTELPS